MSGLLDAATQARSLTGQIHDAVDDWEICGRLPGPPSPASVQQAKDALGLVEEAIRRLLAVRDVWQGQILAVPVVEVEVESPAQLGLVVPEG